MKLTLNNLPDKEKRVARIFEIGIKFALYITDGFNKGGISSIARKIINI